MGMRNKKLIILFSVLLGITLLVVFNSVLFSVQHVQTYCANAAQSQYDGAVLESAGIRKGGSIFLVNKSKVTRNIESNVAGVRVLNVEKKFPNRIYLNFVEVREYVKATYNGKTYFCGNDMRVMRIADGLGEEGDAIRLRFDGALSALNVGDTLSFEVSRGIRSSAVVAETFRGLEQLGYYDTVIDLFTEIDLTGNFLTLKTAQGMSWEFVTADRLAEKLRLALSVYTEKLTDVQKRAGTLVVAGAETVKCSYRGPSGVTEL